MDLVSYWEKTTLGNGSAFDNNSKCKTKETCQHQELGKNSWKTDELLPKAHEGRS